MMSDYLSHGGLGLTTSPPHRLYTCVDLRHHLAPNISLLIYLILSCEGSNIRYNQDYTVLCNSALADKVCTGLGWAGWKRKLIFPAHLLGTTALRVCHDWGVARLIIPPNGPPPPPHMYISAPSHHSVSVAWRQVQLDTGLVSQSACHYQPAACSADNQISGSTDIKENYVAS